TYFSQNHDNKSFYLEKVFGSVNINGEVEEMEMYNVPPLESVSVTSENNIKMENINAICNGKDTNNISSYHFDDINNNINVNNSCNGSDENRAHHEVENLFHEDLNVGDWDLEELMKDVSSFPFLDFSN
uniref:Transcription factor MYB83-like n=1 Tax=Cicer arietinum TaxID=3827 RepID=A0A1S3DW36_CICAR